MDFAVSSEDFFPGIEDVAVDLLSKPRESRIAHAEIAKILIPSLRILVETFTASTSEPARSPLADPRLLSAYLVYYGVRAFWVTRLFARHYGLDGARVLDLGSGPGSAGLALLTQADSHLTLVDPSATALDAARRLAIRLRCAAPRTITSEVEKLDLGKDRYSTIVISNSLNEWPVESEARLSVLDGLHRHLQPGGRLLIIEPARRHMARDLSELRDGLLQRGWSILGPCTHMQPCPMLNRRRDFCHGHKRLDLPDQVKKLARDSGGLDVEDADFSSMVFARGDGPRLKGFRSVGEARREKGRTRWFVCGEPGLVELFALNKHKLPLREKLTGLQRGDVIDVQPAPDGATARLDRLDSVEGRGWLP